MTFSAFQVPPPADWQAFERLARDLFARIWKNEHATLNGRGGQEQNGVDVSGINLITSKWEGVQCKGKDGRFGHAVTVSELRKEVTKALTFTPQLSHYFLISTGPADAAVEREARKISDEHVAKGLFQVNVFGWDHLLARLQDHFDVAKNHFPIFFADTAGSVQQERELDTLRRVLVVELRGLVDTSDRPLVSAVPGHILGRREDCHIDIRPLVSGLTPNVSAALEELAHLRRQVQRARGGASREHISVVVGGVMQVPLLFYAGVLLDDEGSVTLMDWDRTKSQWGELDLADDGSRFTVSGLELAAGAPDVVLAVSSTYQADLRGIEQTFPGLPLVHLQLADPKPNTLWSEPAQAEMTAKFLDMLAALANCGVETVHLVLVASPSLAIRFGRAYDARNMPVLRCYQYQKGAVPAYPWSVRMPTALAPVAVVPTVFTADSTPA